MAFILDGHTHIGLASFVTRPIPPEKLKRPAFQNGAMENTTANLIARMDANHVQQAVAFGFPLEEVDRVQANAYVFAARDAYPDRIIPFALVDDEPERWLAAGARGFKQHDILDTVAPFDIRRTYNVIAASGVPVLIHFRAGDGFDVAAQVKTILHDAPGIKIILAHMGRNKPNTSEKVEAALLGLRDEANVLFETSTVRDPQIIARAVALVGDTRVAFGSDYPFNSYLNPDPLAVEIQVIRDADISSAAKEKILGGNMQTFLGL